MISKGRNEAPESAEELFLQHLVFSEFTLSPLFRLLRKGLGEAFLNTRPRIRLSRKPGTASASRNL